MWHEKLKATYTEKTFKKFEEFVRGTNPTLLRNMETDLLDWYYSTAEVMQFEMKENLDNTERAFPQK